MGVIVLPFLWLGLLMTGIAVAGAITVIATLIREGYPLGAALFILLIAFILFAWLHWGG